MKRSLAFALCVIGFMFIAAPTAVEFHPVFLNGKPFGNAASINGVLAIKVKDVATAAGDMLTLEHFKLNGRTLTTVPDGTSDIMKNAAASPAKKVREAALVPANQKALPGTTVKGESHGLIIVVRKAGNVSNKVFMFEGQAWMPFSDFLHALGVSNQPAMGNLKPNESIQLNATSNVNALIGLL
jgi:hypothetical protein